MVYADKMQTMTPEPTQLIQPLVKRFAAMKPLRTGSLLVSIFGDTVNPRGGVVWLGNLIQVLEPLGVSHRLVRTAAYRLVQDDILDNEQDGRRSYYTLTANGRRRFDEATERIYSQPSDQWNGHWRLVVLNGFDAATKTLVKKDLAWLGFGQLSSDVLAHPNPNRGRLIRHLENLDVLPECVMFDAQLPIEQTETGVAALVEQAWHLTKLEEAYADYIAQFLPLLNAVKRRSRLDEADAFYIRTFMIHEYRKVLLRDPELPQELLPTSWKGHQAYQLTRDLYRLVTAASERFVDGHFINQIGSLPAPQASFFNRFGGLEH